MLQRICPNCKNALQNSDWFFCSFCGVSLPENLTTQPSFTRPTKIPEMGLTSLPRLNFNRKVFGALIILFLILAGIFVVPKISIKFPSSVIYKPLLRLGSVSNVIYFDTKTEFGIFDYDNILTYLPSNTDLFIAMNDLQGFYAEFLFKNKLFSKLPEISKKAVLSHSLQSDKDTWMIFLPVENNAAVLEYVNNFNDPYWNATIIDNYLVIASGKTPFNLAKDLKAEKAKNLALNPQFQKIMNTIQKDGAVQVVILNTTGRYQFENFVNYHSDKTFINLMDEATKTGYNYFVVKGYK